MATDMTSVTWGFCLPKKRRNVNDRMVYLGGWWHREGTDIEAFAQGMYQTPSVSNPNGNTRLLRSQHGSGERPNMETNGTINTNPKDHSPTREPLTLHEGL